MTATEHAIPGHFPLRAGRTVSLEPRLCGELRVGAGTLALDGRPVGAGEARTLWRGDRAQLANAQAEGTAHFAWEVCAQQPTLLQRLRRALGGRRP